MRRDSLEVICPPCFLQTSLSTGITSLGTPANIILLVYNVLSYKKMTFHNFYFRLDLVQLFSMRSNNSHCDTNLFHLVYIIWIQCCIILFSHSQNILSLFTWYMKLINHVINVDLTNQIHDQYPKYFFFKCDILYYLCLN